MLIPSADYDQILYRRIGRPETMHAYRRPGGMIEMPISDPDSYRASALDYLRETGPIRRLTNRRKHPGAFVSCGRWVAQCDCGSGASASPEWRLAICFECGAVYRPQFPVDWPEAETELLKRSDPNTRNWMPDDESAQRYGLDAPETVAMLTNESKVVA